MMMKSGKITLEYNTFWSNFQNLMQKNTSCSQFLVSKSLRSVTSYVLDPIFLSVLLLRIKKSLIHECAEFDRRAFASAAERVQVDFWVCLSRSHRNGQAE